jgi:predicted DNA-binding protein YlxM (UPF0122 family)
MANRYRSHSSIYQNLLIEVPVCPFIMSDLSLAQGITYRMQPDSYNELYWQYKEQLKNRLFELVEENLTDRQKQVIKLWMDGFTQNEIAKKLGINQTSVHKVICGNIDYKNEKRRYGGALKKLKKICEVDLEIQRLLRKLVDLGSCLEL